MPKSSVDLLQTNKNYKNGIITGMLLAKEIRRKKKLKGGFGIKQAIAIAAGPLGWVWLARHKNDEEMKQLKEKLEKYEKSNPTKKQDAPKIGSNLSDEDLYMLEELSKIEKSKDGKKGKDDIMEFDVDDFE